MSANPFPQKVFAASHVEQSIDLDQEKFRIRREYNNNNRVSVSDANIEGERITPQIDSYNCTYDNTSACDTLSKGEINQDPGVQSDDEGEVVIDYAPAQEIDRHPSLNKVPEKGMNTKPSSHMVSERKIDTVPTPPRVSEGGLDMQTASHIVSEREIDMQTASHIVSERGVDKVPIPPRVSEGGIDIQTASHRVSERGVDTEPASHMVSARVIDTALVDMLVDDERNVDLGVKPTHNRGVDVSSAPLQRQYSSVCWERWRDIIIFLFSLLIIYFHQVKLMLHGIWLLYYCCLSA